ncbi:MAG: hypothetical protein EXX96DRAFT_273436 [Benjaminiella poitrasii]|nr:MAG: hypothetical protein EXX96DRAFT_273436 [Benjaminiella poitrasii]
MINSLSVHNNKTNQFVHFLEKSSLSVGEIKELIVRQILNVSAIHQAKLHGIINKGYKLIRYVRKSLRRESTMTRLHLLESMIDKLMKTSYVNMVFSLYSSASDELFVGHDTTSTTIIPRTTGKPLCMK